MKPYLLALLLAISLLTPVRANISAFGSGNTATGSLLVTDPHLRVLEEHPFVSIEHEDLHIRLHDSYATVDLSYTLRNEGGPTNVITGFPSIAAKSASNEPQPTQPPPPGTRLNEAPKDLEGYTINLNGQQLQWQLYAMGAAGKVVVTPTPEGPERMTRNAQWLLSELPLPAQSDNTVHITYKCPYEVFRYYVSDDGTISDATFAYQLSTGANWHGPIHEGHVEIECVGVAATFLRFTPSKRFKQVGKSFIWDFTDLEPTTADDIHIIADPAHEERGGYTLYPDRWYYNRVPYTAKASSELTQQGRHFSASNLTGGGDLCWVEGVEDDGIGESVTLTLKKPTRIDGFTLNNGFSADDLTDSQRTELYSANNRVAQLEVKVDDRPSFRAVVPDEPYGSFIRFPSGSVTATKVKLTIAAVYRGTKYRDTCISSIGIRQMLNKKPEVGHAR